MSTSGDDREYTNVPVLVLENVEDDEQAAVTLLKQRFDADKMMCKAAEYLNWASARRHRPRSRRRRQRRPSKGDPTGFIISADDEYLVDIELEAQGCPEAYATLRSIRAKSPVRYAGGSVDVLPARVHGTCVFASGLHDTDLDEGERSA